MLANALYEATRGVWKVGERREYAHLALAVFEGVVREVYAIHDGSRPERRRTKRAHPRT